MDVELTLDAFREVKLILLDLRLPGIDGFEVLRQVKSTIFFALSAISKGTGLR